jgi:hypothetical protein
MAFLISTTVQRSAVSSYAISCLPTAPFSSPPTRHDRRLTCKTSTSRRSSLTAVWTPRETKSHSHAPASPLPFCNPLRTSVSRSRLCAQDCSVGGQQEHPTAIVGHCWAGAVFLDDTSVLQAGYCVCHYFRHHPTFNLSGAYPTLLPSTAVRPSSFATP